MTTTAYHAVKEKWKLTIKRGLSMMTQVIRLGSHGTDNGWAHYNNISRNFLIFYNIVQGIGTLCFDHVTAFILCSLNV